MNVVDVERDFTALIAGKLNFEIDKHIFRGNMPEKISEGVAVLFGAQIPASGFYGFRPQTWNVQILAKFMKRDAAMAFQCKTLQLIPEIDGTVFGNTVFRTVEPRGTSEPFQGTDRGKTKWFVSVNLILSVLTNA